jgi:hypothetical protein
MKRAMAGRMALACLLSGPAARASTTDTVSVHLSYTVPSACSTEGAFLEMVAGDGTAIESAPDSEPAPSLAITVETSDAVVGHLRLRAVDGTEFERTITGPHCEEVVQSLAVIVALSIQPAAGPAVMTQRTLDAADRAPDAGRKPPTDDTANPAPLSVWRVPEAPDANNGRPDPWRTRWRPGASFELGTSAGPSPSLGFTMAFYGEVMHETPDILAPSLRVGVEKSWGNTDNLHVTTLDKLVVRLDGCPWRFMVEHKWSNDTFTAQVCARADMGWVDAASGFDTPNVRRAWLATGGLLRLRWLFPSSFLEAEGGVDLPLTRYRFSSNGGVDFEVPPATGTVGFGYGFLFL